MKTSLRFVGNTPMYQLEGTNIFAKLEKYNLGGSVKDRAVLGMYQQAMESGLIKEDSIIVEATSGNTGIAIALFGSLFNKKVVIVMPESMSVERRQLIQAYGAQLVLTPKEEGTKGAIEKAHSIIENNPSAISLSQFDNPANPAYHYETTGKEIFEQVPQVDIFVAGVGTGGTFTGVVKYLKERKNILAVAVEPVDSPVLSKGVAGPHKIQGIGAGFVPENFDATLMDEVVTITNEEAIDTAKQFMRETGIGVGISSGAALASAKQLATRYPDKTIVTVLPDGSDKYLSVFDFEPVTYVEV